MRVPLTVVKQIKGIIVCFLLILNVYDYVVGKDI